MDDLYSLFALLIGSSDELFVLMTGVAVIAILFFCIFLIGGVGYLMTILTIAASVYPIARIKARGTPFIKKGPLFELMESLSIIECIAKLHTNGVLIPDIPEDLDHVEVILEKAEFESYQDLLRSIPLDILPFFEAFIKFYEVRIIKRVIRYIHDLSKASEIIDSISHEIFFSEDFYHRLSRISNLEEFLLLLKDSGYGFLEGAPLQTYHESGSLLPLELALDAYVYENLTRSCQKVRSQFASSFLEQIGYLIDIQNIRTLMRGKHAGISQEYLLSSLIDGGLNFPQLRLVQMNRALSLPDLITELIGTEYERILHPLLPGYPGEGGLSPFEVALDKFLLSTSSRLALIYYFTGGPLIKYIIAKNMEFRNLNLILTGIFYGVKREDIKQLLVWEEEV